MAIIEASALGGKWSETTAWTGGKVPGKEDDVVLSKLSGSIEISATAECRSLESSEYTKTLKQEAELKIGFSTSNAGLAIRLGASMTYEVKGGKLTFVSTSTEVQKIFFGGHTVSNLKFNGSKGKWILEEAYKSEGSIELEAKGELNTNGYSCTGLSLTRISESKLNLSGSMWSCKLWEIATLTTGITITTNATTILIVSESFKGGGFTYNGTVELTGKVTTPIIGSNTFAKLVLNTAGKKVTFEKGTTQTITESITGNGKSGELVKLESSEAGKTWEISKASGIVSLNFLELKDSHAVGGAEWYAGASSASVSNNTGWKFENSSLKEIFQANLQFAGKLTYQITHPLTGILTFIGSLSRLNLIKAIQANLNGAGTLTYQATHVLTGTLTSIGSLSRLSLIKALQANLLSQGFIQARISHLITGFTQFTGLVSRNTTHNRTANLSMTGFTSHRPIKNFGSMLSSIGNLGLKTNHELSSKLSFLGGLKFDEYIQKLSALLKPSGTVTFSIKHTLMASTTPAGSLKRFTAYALTALLETTETFQKSILHNLPGLLTISAQTPSTTRYSLSAYVSSIAELKSSVLRQVRAALSSTGNVIISHTMIQSFVAALELNGSIRQRITHNLQVVIKFVGQLKVEEKHIPTTIVYDQLIHVDLPATITMLASDTYEFELPNSKLKLIEFPSDKRAALVEARNQTVLLTYDLAIHP